MTGKLGDQGLNTLEQRFQALRDQVGVMPETCRPELETALHELSQAIAALRTDCEAGANLRPDSAGGREAQAIHAGKNPTPIDHVARLGGCEAMLRHVFNAIPDLLTVHDRDFNTILSNWHGYESVPETERRSQPRCYQVYHHRDRPCDHCHAMEVLATGRPVRLQKVNPADGRVREVSAYPIQDESGQVVLVVEHVRDTTDRHLAGQALEESEGRFRTLIEDSPESLFLTDVQGTVLAASRVAARRIRKELSEVVGRSAFEYLPQEVASRRRVMFDQVIATGRPVRFEDVRDGLHFDINFNPILDADGKVSRLSILAIDITNRKKAEQALKEKTRLNQILLDAFPCVALLLRPQAREIVACNAEAVKVGALPGAKCYSTWGRRQDPCPWCQAPVVWATGEAQHLEVEARGLAWEAHWIPVAEDLYMHFAFDVTAHKQAEAALRESETTLRGLIESNPESLFLLDTRGVVLAASKVAAQRLGKSLEKIIGADAFTLVGPEVGKKRFKIFQQVVATGQPRRFEDVRGDFHLEISMNPIFDQGKVVRVAVLGVDITARKQAEAELRESEQRFRLMAETIQDVFWIATPTADRVIYANPAYEQVWGQSCQELYQNPQRFRESIHPEDRDRALATIVGAREQGIPSDHEYRIIKPDGAVRWIHDRGYPVWGDRGLAILFVGVATDITERKALEGQLLQAQKMEALGRLAGGVAHDFNNLLMAIMGYGELMRSNVLRDDPLYSHLENILKAGDRAAALTQQLLTFSRQKIFQPQVVDLNRVVLDLEPMLRRLIGEDLDLEVVTDRRLGAVKADPGQVGQIIMNLVVNSRDAMPQGGRLTLKTATVDFTVGCNTRFGLAPPGPYVSLEVQDTGVGMDMATQAHVFEPFFTTKEPGKGTGLGLSTVYGIVKHSGGYLDLASEPGVGSAFTIYLPRLEGIVDIPKAKIPITASFQGKETILLVEDEDMLRGLLAKFLRLCGYTVLEARHGGEALLTCERNPGPIHLMVTDVVMPRMSGRELADRLTPLRPEMKVLYMSGYTEEALVQHGVADLSVAFLQKPFKPIELARRVHAVLHLPVTQ
jgi:two-component system, cell cycle sensor histidine kinase and response regulator CckA